MAKMRWHKAQPTPRTQTTRQERRLEAKADHMLLKSDPKEYPQPRAINPHYDGAINVYPVVDTSLPERAYYRSVGAVAQNVSTGIWSAIGRDGVVLGTFNTRWEAWRCADKLGMERAGVLG